MQVVITAPVFATELEERVRKAVSGLFPDAQIEARKDPGTRQGSDLRATSTDIETFATKLRDQKIRDTARGVLRDSVVGNDISFYLGKQAAFAGKVNLTEGDSLLCDIRGTIRCDDPGAVIDWLTSKEEAD